jgi:hypothetical protein
MRLWLVVAISIADETEKRLMVFDDLSGNVLRPSKIRNRVTLSASDTGICAVGADEGLCASR